VAEMKDYKKVESLDTGLVGGSGLIWMFSGIVLGLMVGIGMYFLSNNNNTHLISTTDSVQNKIVKAQGSSSKQESLAGQEALAKQTVSSKQNTSSINKQVKHQKIAQKKTEKSVPFSYYAVLPNLDVPVNTAKPIETRVDVISEKNQAVEIIANQDNIEEATQQKSQRKRGDYLLQVASFKRKSMAKLTRGRLAKKGVKAYIKKRKVKGRMWYRVVAGPVDQGNIDTWKHTAEKLGHRPMVISVR
jgi:cell division protein FtsN